MISAAYRFEIVALVVVGLILIVTIVALTIIKKKRGKENRF